MKSIDKHGDYGCKVLPDRVIIIPESSYKAIILGHKSYTNLSVDTER